MITWHKEVALDRAEPRPMYPEMYTVRSVQQETADTFTFEFEPVDAARLFVFGAGQFNMLYMYGFGEVAISISGDPTAGVPIITHTIRAVGPTTKAICRLKKGDSIGIRGPFGSRWPVEAARGHDVLFVTGGIGLAPLRPAIYYVLANREQYGQLSIMYGARSPDRLLFKQELERWRGRFDVDLDVAVGSAPPTWRGNVGVITSLISRARVNPLDTVAMLCSSEAMMRSIIRELGKRGVDVENTFVSMERNMKCGVGFCGHCQFGPDFMCREGPVFRLDAVSRLFDKREV